MSEPDILRLHLYPDGERTLLNPPQTLLLLKSTNRPQNPKLLLKIVNRNRGINFAGVLGLQLVGDYRSIFSNRID